MKVLLTAGFDGNGEAFERELLEEVTRLVDSGGAQRAAIDVRVGGDERALLQDVDTARDASALVSLWEPVSSDTALKLALPPDSRLVGAYRVDEVVQRDYDRTWPTGVRSPGVKLVCFVRRRPDLSPEAYSRHWRERHGPLALAHQPGFWHYVQNHVVERLTDETPDYDGIGELHFRSAPEVQTGMFDTEEGQRLIWEDTERFMNHDGSVVLVTNERLVGSDPVLRSPFE
ncbi:MAG TPA: EthD domain-containing protein [Acidimicrobiia bacterium]|nr:EthD domain-containing protein [Acidimicrobiia bacterium]